MKLSPAGMEKLRKAGCMEKSTLRDCVKEAGLLEDKAGKDLLDHKLINWGLNYAQRKEIPLVSFSFSLLHLG